MTRLATAAGMEVVGRDALRTEDVDPVDEARKTVAGAPDCVMVAAGIDGWAPRLFDALHAEDPALELFGGDGLATPSFAAALRPGTQARTHLVGPVGITEPVPAVRAFARRYEAAFGLPARSGALYGNEAMRLVLAAIQRAGATGNNRAAVTRARPLSRYQVLARAQLRSASTNGSTPGAPARRSARAATVRVHRLSAKSSTSSTGPLSRTSSDAIAGGTANAEATPASR